MDSFAARLFSDPMKRFNRNSLLIALIVLDTSGQSIH